MGNNNDKKLSLEEAREKYRIEREKRLRADGIRQYKELKGDYEEFDRDPYVEPGFTRDAVIEDVDVVIVGGGFGGMIEAANLTKAGITNFRIIEKAGDFGGTWYWNRYPDAACDVESYVYLPLLEDTGYMPTEKYAKAPEIFAYCQLLGRTFDLYRGALFQTEVEDMRWDESRKRWNVMTSRSDILSAKFIVIAGGVLHKAKLPGIPGIETYAGRAFHTSRWDYDYTGGDSTGGLSKLKGKRVGIIGTGATAVQCVPHLGASADQLFVFQRTPSSIDVRNNRPTDSEWAASLQPGWQKERMDNFNALVSGGFAEVDLVQDGWTDIIGNLLIRLRQDASPDLSPEGLARNLELADFEKMEQIRARVENIVSDPSTAEHLKPWYRQFCKRPCFHDDYLPTFNRPNVTLVDTGGLGVERITPKGVVANGVEYELDCLVYATGFEVGTDYARRSGYETTGSDNLTLTSKWAEGVETFHGFFSRGFPNCFLVSTAQSGFSVNFPHMLNEQAIHIAHVVKHATEDGITRIEASAQAEHDWVEDIKSNSTMNLKFLEACTPGYYNNEGKPAERAAQNGSYGKGPVAFVRLLESWRAAGDFAGLEMSK